MKLYNVCQGKDSHQPSNGNHWWLWQKNSKQPHCYTLTYFDSDDCCMRDTMAYSASPASTGLLSHQLAYPLWPPYSSIMKYHHWRWLFICLVDGETKWETICWRVQYSSSLSVNFGTLMVARMLWVVWSCLTLVPLEAATVSITKETKRIAFRAVGSTIISTEWFYWYVLSRACFGMLLDVDGILKFGYVWGMYGVCIGTYVYLSREQCLPTNITIPYGMIRYLANPTACRMYYTLSVCRK